MSDCDVAERWGTHGHALGFSVRRGLGLVSDQDVHVGQELIKLDLEELGNERRAQVEGDDLSSAGSGLGDLHGGFDAVGKEETTDVEELCVVDVFLDLGLGQVRGGELFGGSESGDEGSARKGQPMFFPGDEGSKLTDRGQSRQRHRRPSCRPRQPGKHS